MRNWTYCTVGNIRPTHFDGDGTVRYGTAAFRGGTKVYLAARIWDRTKPHIEAYGKTRENRWQIVTTDVGHIENLRVQKVFHPDVLNFMGNHEYRSTWWGKSKREKEAAEAFVQWWNETFASAKEGRRTDA